MRHDDEVLFDRLETVTLALVDAIRAGDTQGLLPLISERESLIDQVSQISVTSPFHSARLARAKADDAELTRCAKEAHEGLRDLLATGHENRRNAGRYRGTNDSSRLDRAG